MTTRSKGTGSRRRKASRRLRHEDTGHARNYAQVAYEFAVEASKDTRGKKHCKWVRLAAKRHLKDLERKRFAFEFVPWHANDICDFVEKFPHIEGSWDSDTITLEPPQIFILCCVFGWRRKDDGNRRFTSVYIEMARKGAKSTLTAPVAHYCLTCEDEVGPQIIIGATTGDQANKVFQPARKMAEKSSAYREAFGVEVWSKSITCNRSGGFIQPINAKSSTQDGWNPHVGILDELHAHSDRGLFDVIRSAFGARKNPLMWMITTAGYNVHGVCYEQHMFVKKVLEGIFKADHYFGAIFTLDEGDSEFDESKWIKANPLLGVTPTLESMRSLAAEAKASPGQAGEFKTKRLNVWTSARDAWLNMRYWAKCNGAPLDLDWLRQFPCFGGLDLAQTSDITALVLVWLIEGRLYLKGRYYLPEDVVKPRTERGNVAYQAWADQGLLLTTPGEVTDYDYIERDIYEAMERFDVQQIGFDRWNSSQLINNLQTHLDDEVMVQLAAGPKTFDPPMREFERLWKSGRVHHGNDPVLKWALSNVVAKTDDNLNMKPSKKQSHEKIDPVVAMMYGLERALSDEVEGPSVYEERGLREVEV